MSKPEITETHFRIEDEGGGSAGHHQGRRVLCVCLKTPRSRNLVTENDDWGDGIGSRAQRAWSPPAGRLGGKSPTGTPSGAGDGSCRSKEPPSAASPLDVEKRKKSLLAPESHRRKPGSRQTGRARPGGIAGPDVGCSGKKRVSGRLCGRRDPPRRRARSAASEQGLGRPRRPPGGPMTGPAPDNGQEGRPGRREGQGRRGRGGDGQCVATAVLPTPGRGQRVTAADVGTPCVTQDTACPWTPPCPVRPSGLVVGTTRHDTQDFAEACHPDWRGAVGTREALALGALKTAVARPLLPGLRPAARGQVCGETAECGRGG